MRVKPVLTMAKHRKELLSKERATMESGFETDPQFTVIWMPDREDKEQDGDTSTGSTKNDTDVGSDSDSRPGDREFGSDSPTT